MNDFADIKQNVISKIGGFFIAFFGGSPKKYWAYLIAAILALMAGALFLDAWIFWHTTSAAFENISVGPVLHAEAVNRDALDSIIGTLKEREKNFNDTLSAPSVRDPSL